MTGMSVNTGVAAAERGHMVGTSLSGGLAKPIYKAYRKRAAALSWFAGTPDDVFNALENIRLSGREGGTSVA
jgi:hypothetical protein